MQNLFVRHKRLMLKTAAAYMDTLEDAEDAMMDCIVALYRNIPQLRQMDERSLRKYVFVTLRNRCLDALRKHKRIERLVALCSTRMQEADKENDLENQVIRKEFLAKTFQMMEALSESERTAMYLRFGLGFSVSEIADLMDITPDSVTRYISRGKSHLRKEMEDFGCKTS